MNWTDPFSVMQRKTEYMAASNYVQCFGLQYYVVFDWSRLDKRGSSYRGENYIENDLKGNENCFELEGGSSYRGFELLRVKLQQMYDGNPGEIDFGSS